MEIAGNIEEEAVKNPLTLFSYYNHEKRTTVLKVHSEHKNFGRTIEKLYGKLGKILTMELL